MLRVLFLYVLPFALTLYALIDCAQKDETRNLPKWGWILIILFLGVVGPIAYLIAGRPKGPYGRRKPKFRDLPPDDNPDFLRGL